METWYKICYIFLFITRKYILVMNLNRTTENTRDLRSGEKSCKTANSPDIHMAIHNLQGFREQTSRKTTHT